MNKKINIWRLLRLILSNRDVRKLLTLIFLALRDFKLTHEEKTSIKAQASLLLSNLLDHIT